ncbi:hypothetical protein HYX18_00965 [Candidatus Woesearchaeota archaeon]|nr:hypothetical protein [Candidatus Woesearchaeota archaeon]
MVEEILSYKCNCGGILKKSHTNVEFFGIDFGIKECEVCTKCDSEYLSDEVLDEIEQEVKKKKLFGLEKQAQITKSGNSLVVRIPPEIVKFSGIRYKDLVRIYPIGKKKIELEIESD